MGLIGRRKTHLNCRAVRARLAESQVDPTGPPAQRFVGRASGDRLRSLGSSPELNAARARAPPEATSLREVDCWIVSFPLTGGR